MIVIFSLKLRKSRSDASFILASAMPITVTASSPVSCWIALDATKVPITATRITGAFRYSGT